MTIPDGYIIIPGTEALPDPAGGPDGGVQIVDCPFYVWQADSATPSGPLTVKEGSFDGEFIIDYIGGLNAFMYAIFGTYYDQAGLATVGYVEFTNQRNGEIYRMLVRPIDGG